MNGKPLHVGMVLRHHSGRVYTVTGLTNTAHADPLRKPGAVLLGANGNLWSRDADTFEGKFTVLFDGANLAS